MPTQARRKAAIPNKHILYEQAVQAPEADLDFAARTFRKLRGRRPTRLREDFCGTAAICCEWVRRRHDHTAIGLDLHKPTLAWGTAHHVEKLNPEARSRVKLLNRSVLAPGRGTGSMDLILALNFSYWVFKQRAVLLQYFRSVRTSLARDGLFVLDIYGGPDAFDELSDKTPIGGTKRGFTYIWEQEHVDHITNETLCHIHFRLADGRRVNKAFTYDWRIWTIPEVRDVLADAGFTRTTVYWEGEDGKGGGNGIFRPQKHGDCGAAFIAYIVAER